jgi:hypothetical protein
LDREQLQLHVCVLRLVRLMLSSRYWHAHNGTYALVTNPRPIESLMSRSGWVGGQDWDGPHLVVGRLLLGHTVP